MRTFLTSVVGLLPAGRAKNRLLVLLGHKVAATADIRPVLLLPGTTLDVGERAIIGTLSSFRGVRVVLAEAAEIGQLNWVTAAPELVRESLEPNPGSLIIDEHGAITSRHYVDVSGGLHVARFAICAGVRSTFMSHGVDVSVGGLVTSAIDIGEYSMVGGSCSLVPGARVPARCVVGMGSVVAKGLTQSDSLYVGTPAQFKKTIDIGAFGSRDVGTLPVHKRPRP